MPEDKFKQVELRYHAVLREERGLSAEIVSTSAATLRELYQELRGKHMFGLPCESLRVAVNDEFRDWNDCLRQNDRVSLIPPASGG